LKEIAHGYRYYFVSDFGTMTRLLTAAGFVNVRRCAAFDTSVERFKGKDHIDDWPKRNDFVYRRRGGFESRFTGTKSAV
jgi:hypothetical protein